MTSLIRRSLRPIKRRLVRLGQDLTGQTVECNLCGWRGPRLGSDNWHPHTVCPQCGSQVRHRLLVAALTYLPAYRLERLVQGKAVLHFAPELALRARLQPVAGAYRTADLEVRPDLDLALDISAMPAVASASQDLVLACDVLEHVPADQQAMRELCRVLRPGGFAIVTVPQKDGLAITFSDPAVTTPEDRLRVFGQRDHVRIYGDDLPAMLSAAGFKVDAVTADRFSSRLVHRHVLFPPVLSTHPLATNHRKVFFAQKL